ncbi:MAG: hypothetical protein JWN00_1454 [Actinomycetia bacterium]|nr:hypothetical protein [Actinomycetes bacterium]
MKRSDRKLWAGARTLPDLAELTARWLMRDLQQHPGYPGKQGPDPETAGIATELAAINRAGFLTSGSQPGLIDGEYRQRAGVDGFTDPTNALRLAATAGDSVRVIVHAAPCPRRTGYAQATPVTMYGGTVETSFGAHLSRSDIHLIYDLISPAAFEVLYAATQVTVIDLEWGRNTLWSWLLDALTKTPAGA